MLFAQAAAISDRPLTPLHGGHVGPLCTAGMLNGIFGEGEGRHIANWQSVKLVDRTEEDEDGATVVREKERFANELTLVFANRSIIAPGDRVTDVSTITTPQQLASLPESLIRVDRRHSRSLERTILRNLPICSAQSRTTEGRMLHSCSSVLGNGDSDRD